MATWHWGIDREDLLVGQFNEYWCFESRNHMPEKLLRDCPEILLSQYAAVYLRDESPITHQLLSQWDEQDNFLISPKLTTRFTLPPHLCHEVLVFDHPIRSGALSQIETFSEHEDFSLSQPYIRAKQPFKFSAGVISAFDRVQELQELFLEQVERIQPQSYVVAAQNLIFITRNPEVRVVVESWVNS